MFFKCTWYNKKPVQYNKLILLIQVWFTLKPSGHFFSSAQGTK